MFAYFYELLFAIIGLLIIALNLNFLIGVPLLGDMLNLVGALVAVIPAVTFFYRRFRRRRTIEEQFLVFIADLTQAINSGMTLPLALQTVSKRDYRDLTPLVSSLSSQVDWGIPFPKALEIFAHKTDSVPVGRAVKTILQTYKVGGKIADTLDAISKTLLTIENIKKERTSSVYSQLVTSYLIYFVFILILVVLQIFLIPSLLPQNLPSLPGTQGLATPVQSIFAQSFINFILVQGFFAGLVAGKMAEGSLAAGLKHSILLIVVGYTIFSFASQIEIRLI